LAECELETLAAAGAIRLTPGATAAG
jgi:hypothetical protein